MQSEASYSVGITTKHKASTAAAGVGRDGFAAAAAGVAESVAFGGTGQSVDELVYMVQVGAAVAGFADVFGKGVVLGHGCGEECGK